MVPGDLPPKLVLEVINSLSVPLSSIFNSVSSSDWPAQWKVEYQTIIPKNNSPEDLNKCRNLSCTNFFSKILESFVLESLLCEVKLSSMQFGGLKGCGTNHFLLQLWQNILAGLEEDNSAVSMSISEPYHRA